MRKPHFFSFSFGCRVNQAEKEEIDEKMIKAGFVFDKNHPDLFIINSCAVTEKAEREVRQLIHKIKRESPKRQVILVGCAATYWKKNNLYQDLPVDLFVDNANKEFLVNLLSKRFLKQFPINQLGYSQVEKSIPEKTISDKFLSSHRVLIKIQDGCHRFCSFCIVPYLRGLPKSKKIDEIIKEINQKEENIREVILTAINSEAFGKDTEERFVDLVKAVLKRTKILRLSFGSIHPLTIDNDFLKFYQQSLSQNRLVNFFHIPIQSASNKILDLMRRGYKKEEVREKLMALHRLNNQALIGSDIIVGFLEETDSDFEETYYFFEKMPIFKFHVFRFSKRKGTSAYYLADNFKEPDPQTKLKRAKILIELGRKKYHLFLEKQLGTNSLALFLNKMEEGYQEALLQNQMPIYVKTKKNFAGEIKNVKIETIKKGKLFGKII